MGPMEVPADAYYGASTQRAVLNFPLSGLRFGRPFIRVLGLIKQAAASVNAELGLLDANIVWVSGDINGPASTQTAFAALSGTALKIASAAVGDGNGVYDMTPDFRLTVPAETYTGSYSATVTVDISVGP